MQKEFANLDSPFNLYQRFEQLNDDIQVTQTELNRLKQERRELLNVIYAGMGSDPIPLSRHGGAP